MSLPMHGYVAPGHPYGLTVSIKDPRCVVPNLEGRHRHELDANYADAALEAHGVLPTLVAYLEDIGRAAK